MLALLLLVLAADPPACLEQDGQKACGHSCVARFGQVRCAQTPYGICWPEGGTVTCWDPPGHVIDGGGPKPPRPRCLRAGDVTACGYECLAAGDAVKCSQTPEGACFAIDGGVTCWDPPPKVRVRWPDAPRPTCLAEWGVTACGYQCMAQDGKVACAQTPGGLCRIDGQGVTCWDP